jgi:RimJ/RimL family protein N-acetyltransferase
MSTFDIAAEAPLRGLHVSLELLAFRHVSGLVEASEVGHAPGLYRWSPVPRGSEATRRYVDTALDWRQRGDCVPYATVRRTDGRVIGSTRLWNIERWDWPPGEDDLRVADACEIGYTWLAADAVRTAANTEAKLLMLTLAFDMWRVRRVCFHSDVRNDRSRAALTRLGARFEGVLRAHRLAVDLTARDSARYSVLAAEWPEVRDRLRRRLVSHQNDSPQRT